MIGSSPDFSQRSSQVSEVRTLNCYIPIGRTRVEEIALDAVIINFGIFSYQQFGRQGFG